MSRSPVRLAPFLAVLAIGCETYSPAPVDLAAHAEAFAARLPQSEEVQAFVRQLRATAPTLPPFDAADGIELGEARLLALLFHPDLRAARLRAGVAAASAEHAGRWADPVLGGDFARVLDSVQEPWILAGALSITLPLTGRLGLEQELAASEHQQALLAARAAEAQVLDALDAQWAEWSALRLRVDLLRLLLERLRGLEAIAERLAAAQEITRVDARAFALERLSQQGELLHTEAAAAAAELELVQLMGLSPDTPLQLLPTVGIAERVASVEARRASAGAGEGRRLAQRQQECAVAERQLALAIRRQWPDLVLSPGFESEFGEPRVTLGLQLPLPLWNRNARDIATARAARELANEVLRGEYERTLQVLVRAELRLSTARAHRALIETELVPLAEQQVADGRRLAELGQLDTLLQLDAVLRAHAAKTSALDTAVEEALAVVKLNELFWPELAPGTTEVSR